MASNETINEIVNEIVNETEQETSEEADAIVFTCQNLSNFHVVKHWNKLSTTGVARELLRIKLGRCPDDLREGVLTGVVEKKKIGKIDS